MTDDEREADILAHGRIQRPGCEGVDRHEIPWCDGWRADEPDIFALCERARALLGETSDAPAQG